MHSITHGRTAGGVGTLHVCAVDAMPASPLRNGGGTTRELLRWPASASSSRDDWLVRISVADIDADGPFSPFAGVTRTFAVLAGAGVRLRWADRERTLRGNDEPIEFDGADAPGCQLLDGPTRDLNVMVRTGFLRATLTRVVPGTPAPAPAPAPSPLPCTGAGGASRLRGLFTRRPLTLRRAGHDPVALVPLSLAWCDDASARAWTVDTPASNAEPAGQPLAWWIDIASPETAR